jgi:arylsulfatase A-like enzyme
MDACFGRFIGKLKSSGLYDESIVFLTSDHGDLLGEDGRWGHASTIRPEVLRVPLILHAPSRLKEGLRVSEGPAFLTDITPTLYALLGHEPASKGRLFGRPLLSRAAQGPRGLQLVASAFNSVYGILSEGGRSMYAADAVDHSTAWYDLGEGFQDGRRPPTPGEEAEGNAAIRSILSELDRTLGGP